MWARVLSVLAGIWLMAAPAVLGHDGAPAVNDRIVGPLAVASAIIAMSEVTRAVRWAAIPLGLWMLIAIPVLGYREWGAASAAAAGIIFAVLALVRGTVHERFGGGWRSLWRSDASADAEWPGASRDAP